MLSLRKKINHLYTTTYKQKTNQIIDQYNHIDQY